MVAALELMIGLPYHRRQTIAPGVDLTFLDAGHVLGSAIVILDVEDGGTKVRIAFTGDLGLIEFSEAVRKRQGPGTMRRIFLVHGEPAAQAALAKQLVARGFLEVMSPSLGERTELT